jgi:UDP-N-acetyl-D-glucosamine dehydrogenase
VPATLLTVRRKGDGVRAEDDAVRSDPLAALTQRIAAREAPVAVVGLGYVGLPLLLAVGKAGFPIIGYDSDPEKVASLHVGHSYIRDVPHSELVMLEEAVFDSEPSVLKQAEVILMCVPTPLTDNSPDLSLVQGATSDVAAHLERGRLVVLESTTYPGTTEELVRPILEAGGLRAGTDFALAYSPERILPGHPEEAVHTVPKIVAGVTERCREVATSFYGHVVRTLVTTASPRDAEMAKLIENTFRQVNIALVNEMAILARELDVDIWDALHAASTKPFGYMPFWPGPGVGGHCIAIDPSYLSWRIGKQLGYGMGFIEHANSINNRMPDYVVTRIAEALNDHGKSLRDSRILAVGVAYKDGVDDIRQSPALAVIERLAAKGVILSYHDPFVDSVEIAGRSMKPVQLTEAVVRNQDCVAVLTAHSGMDYGLLVRAASLLFDTRGISVGMYGPNVVRL